MIGHETWTVAVIELGGGIRGRLEGRHDREIAAVCAEVREALGAVSSPVLDRVQAVVVSVPGTTTGETLVEYCFRKCRGWMIAGGSIEILKNRIAESVFERAFSQRPPKN